MKGKMVTERSQEKSLKLGKFEDCEEECKYGSIWVILTFVFLMISTILLITLVCLCVIRDRQKTSLHYRCNNTGEYLDANRSRRYANKLKFTRTNGSDVFEELSRFEIEAVVNFLHDQKHLNLVDPKNATVKSNFIHSIEMKLPVKYDVISYLHGDGNKPDRMATVYLFMGANEPPSVDEYVVGGIGSRMYARRINTDRRKTNIPFEIRPYSTAEFKFIFKVIISKIVKLAKNVLMESYGALPFKCGNKCLKLSMAPISNAFLPEGTRKGWFYFLYDAEFPSVRPLDFLFLVDSTSVNPNEWKIENVWYANQMFSNISIFLKLYNEDKINKTRVKFPDEEEKKYGSMEFRTPLIPEESLRAPRQIEPDGHRFQITDNEVHYMQWKTNFRVSTTGGLQLLNIRFNGERIIYELSMQEVIVMYGGHNPLSRIMNYADGAGLYGTRYRGLLPGVDCPGNAEFVNTYLYASNEMGARVFENGFCVFELNTHSLLRRHRAYGRSGALYGGLEASALVIRSIISVVNYDYVFDFMFYPNGGIETKVSMTGYLGTTFYFPEERAYGTQVHQNVAAALHNHLFHFKVDLDIKGTENRYETYDVKTRLEENPWYPGKSQHQAIVEKNLKASEQDALYKYNFETPKTHVFSNHNHTTPLGNVRGYRIELQKMSKQLIPVGEGFENGIPWSRYQMAVTKYKPEEERSSSVFTMWDSKDPVVNFQKYIDDDDGLVDQDLVSWITIGTQHLPHTENLPTSITIGSQLSFHVLPFNYFDEDPSMHSRDAVRITPWDKRKPLDGAKVEHYGTFDDVDCALNYNLPKDILEKNSTFLFS
ncbi:tryptamine:oxygen oxidoreductase (deaminating) [Mactra antiquata]